MQTPWIHIVGGGLAGLSLARELARYDTLPGAVIVSERRTEYSDDRTFSFWCSESERAYLQPQTLHTRWSISAGSTTHVMQGQRYAYGTRSSIDFYKEAMASIEAHPAIHWRHETCQQAPTAHWVFDSRPPQVDQFQVVQSFHGVVARTIAPHHIHQVSLMDDLQTIAQGVRFRYVVPLSPNELLVEYTDFAAAPSSLDALGQHNQTWLNETFGSQWQTVRTEQAHIPMGLKGHGQHFGTPIGTRGGMARDATGYSYVRTQHWARACARCLIVGKRWPPVAAPVWEQWMDQRLLQLITQRPDCVPGIFMRMAKRLDADVFARFMMQQTPMDALKVILVSPKKPFLCASIGQLQWI